MRRFKLRLMASMLVISARGGSEERRAAGGTTPPTDTRTNELEMQDIPAVDAVQAGSETSATVPAAINAFALDLYPMLAQRERNFAYSPASISLALAMTSGGARGDTLHQMLQALHLGGDAHASERTAADYGELLSAWNDRAREGDVLAVVNRMFGEKTLSFKAEFVSQTNAVYRSELQPADFLHRPDVERGNINGWVEEQTFGKIEDLLPAGSITSQTSLVLTNAVYFKGKWKHAFDPQRTAMGPFFPFGGSDEPQGRNVQVPMMKQRAALRYAASDGARIVELPYGSGRLAMDIVLPDANTTLASLEARLDSEVVSRWTDALVEQQVDLTLPRFTIDPPDSMRLKSVLTALGMALAFTRQADFSGISELPTFIDDVFHRAFVEVNEEGTEAAAATAVAMKPASAVPTGAVSFTVDRPFLFMIRDLDSGAILFAGRYAEPPR